MLTAVAFLAVILLITAGVLQQVASQQRAADRHLRQLQTNYLAESALELAAVKLKADTKYAGETWEPVVQLASSQRQALIQITVHRESEQPSAKASISVRYPANASEGNYSQAALERTISLKP